MVRTPVLALALTALLLAAAVPHALAQEAGSSTGVGEIDFPNSGSPDAQPAFLRGLGLLHNFEYADAAGAFAEARSIDSDFAMAAWGEAMTHNHPVWMEQDSAAGRALLAELGPTPEARLAAAPTDRERAYIGAIEVLYNGAGGKRERDRAYAAAMRELHEAYPDDPDAAAFYALSLLGTAHEGRDFATYMRAAAVAQDVFRDHPRHPGAAHYLIHSFDDPIHAPLGLPAARAYASIAPEAAHAQHMTSHIFVAMGLWEDVVRANETALDVVNRARAREGRPPAACGHYSIWLQYGLHQLGRHAEAAERLRECHGAAVEAAGRDAPRDVASALVPDNTLAGSLASMRLRSVLETESWEGGALELEAPPSEALGTRVTLAFTDAFAAARRGDLEAARAGLAALGEIERELDAALAADGGDSDRHYGARARILAMEVEAAILAAEARYEEAVELLASATAMEEELPFTFGPPFIDKPTHELLGDVLLEAGRAEEAADAYRATLDRAPGRRLAHEGLKRTKG